MAYAYLPPQTVRAGVIRVDVVEPTYDRPVVSGTPTSPAAPPPAPPGVTPAEPGAECSRPLSY